MMLWVAIRGFQIFVIFLITSAHVCVCLFMCTFVCLFMCTFVCLLQRDRADGEIIETGATEIAETGVTTTEAVCLH